MQATESTQFTLELALQDFQQRFNDSGRAKKLAKKWNRQVFVDASDEKVVVEKKVFGSTTSY